MKTSAADQQSIVQLLTRIYSDIRDIEVEYQLFAGGHDFGRSWRSLQKVQQRWLNRKNDPGAKRGEQRKVSNELQRVAEALLRVHDDGAAAHVLMGPVQLWRWPCPFLEQPGAPFGAVAARTSRRTSAGRTSAISWATNPPIENPSRSMRSRPSAEMNAMM